MKSAKYKFLWVGGIMGIAQQLLGRLDYYLYHGRNVFSFTALMGGLSLYAAIILFVIRREASPKQQFADLFLFFLGLDFFYYLYVFIMDLIWYLPVENHSHEIQYYFQCSLGEIFDFIKWTVIGTTAGFWASAATKLRNNGKKLFYRIMLSPLFAVMILDLSSALFGMYYYIIQEYHKAHGIANPEGISRLCPVAELLVSSVVLAVCVFRMLPPHQKCADTGARRA